MGLKEIIALKDFYLCLSYAKLVKIKFISNYRGCIKNKFLIIFVHLWIICFYKFENLLLYE